MNAEDAAERRQFSRLNTGAEYRILASYGSVSLGHVHLKSLSASGCSVQLLVEEVPALEVGTILERLLLLHPDLPMVPLQGTVMWILGKHPAKTQGPITAGLDFAPITPFVQELIQEHVQAAEGI